MSPHGANGELGYLDLHLFLTHIAVETYVADYDCILGDVFGMNNFHFYRFVNKQCVAVHPVG